jgi:hypothetical protein
MTKGRAVLPARVVAERLGFAVACVEMCELSELSELSQVANPFPPRRDDLSAHEPRMGDGPVCHPAPGMDSGRPGGCGVFQVVKTTQSRGRTERTLFWDNFSYPQARLRGGAGMLRTDVTRHFNCHFSVCYT